MGLSVMQLPPGTRVASNYVLEGLLGRGGMGCVYRARQESTDRPCALKLLDPRFIVASAHEPKIASRIESDHVVKVLDAGTDDKLGVRWIAMELLDGWDLETFVEHHGALQGESAIQALEQLFHAIAAAHRADVAHCDLKPNNVFLHRPKEVSPLPFKIKVLDFGVAKKLSGGVAQHSTAGMGAPGWIAPERCRGQRRNQASDVYCLGLLAFYAITGKEFWVHAQGDDFDPVAVMGEVLFEPMPLASQRAAALGAGHLVPPEFDAWFARCTDREPSHRYPDAGQAWVGLKGVLEAIRSREGYPRQERPSDRTQLLEGRGSNAPAPIPEAETARRDGRLRDPAWGSTAPGPVGVRAPPDGQQRTQPSSRPPDMLAGRLGGEPDEVSEGRLLRGLRPQATSVPFVQIPKPPPRRQRRRSGLLWGALAAGLLVVTVLAIRAGGVGEAPPPLEALAASGSTTGVDPPPRVSGADGMVRIQGGSITLDGVVQTLEPFYIDQTEVTVQEWWSCTRLSVDACDDDVASPYWNIQEGTDVAREHQRMRKFAPLCNFSRREARAQHPINCVSYQQAQTYCRSKGKTLPSLAQWALAAHGTAMRPYPWGQPTPDSRGIIVCGSACQQRLAAIDQSVGVVPALAHALNTTAPVGSSVGDTTPDGVKDMAANLREWTSTKTAGGYLVAGHSWASPAIEAFGSRSAGLERPGNVRDIEFGFRCARQGHQGR